MFNKIIFCSSELNGKINDTKTFSENDITNEELKILNKNGYNIYHTVNSFQLGDKRDKKHLGEFKNIFIDLDYDENLFNNKLKRETFMNEKYIEVYKKVLILFNEFGVFPKFINETYKGYHIIYELDNDLAFINEELYMKILDFFVSFFEGDIRAKDITRVYKVFGYKDNFKNRNFIIKNKIENNDVSGLKTYISKKTLDKLNFIVKYDEKKLKKYGYTNEDGHIIEDIEKKYYEKIFKKDRNFELINNIPFSKLMFNLNEYFNKEICKINNGLVSYDGKIYGGIKWNSNGDYINDFSHGKNTGENRANGNKNFLINVVFYNDFESFIKFLSIKFNIIWNKSTDYVPQSMVQSLGIIKGEYNLYSEENNNLNKLILKGVDLSEYIKYIVGMLTMINEKKYNMGVNSTGEKSYLFNFNDYLKRIGINSIKNGSIRRKIKEDLLRMSYLKREKYEEIQTENGELVDVISYVPLFNIGFGVGGKKSDIISLKVEKFNKINYFNKNILNIKTKNNKVLMFAYKISVNCNKGKKFSMSEDKTREELGIGVLRKDKYKDKVKKHLKLLKDQSIVKSFEFNSKNGIYIYT